jgi:hypothetical protein
MTRTAPESSSSQRARILGRLIAAHGAEVPLSEISSLAAQYNSRIWSLRKLGFKIENRVEEVDGVRRSWFRLVSSPAQASSPATPPVADRDDDPQTIPPSENSDPREQLQLFSTKADSR